MKQKRKRKIHTGTKAWFLFLGNLLWKNRELLESDKESEGLNSEGSKEAAAAAVRVPISEYTIFYTKLGFNA